MVQGFTWRSKSTVLYLVVGNTSVFLHERPYFLFNDHKTNPPAQRQRNDRKHAEKPIEDP